MLDLGAIALPERYAAYVAWWHRKFLQASRRLFLAQVHLTRRCEAKCTHCYFRELPAPGEPDMPTERAIGFLESFAQDAARRGLDPRIDFTGGDPLLYPDFWRVAQVSRDLGITVKLKGNPHRLDAATVERLMRLGITDIRLSLDGLRETHDGIRGRGNFDLTLKAMQVIKESGCVLRLHTTVSRANWTELIHLYSFLLSQNFLIDDISWSRYWSLDTPDDVLRGDEALELCSLWLAFAKALFEHRDFYVESPEGRVIPRLFIGFKEHVLLPLLVESGVLSRELCDVECQAGGAVSCTLNRHVYIIEVDGTVYKCRKIVASNIGNAFTGDWRAVVESDANRSMLNIRQKTLCSECQYYSLCGGCRALAEVEFGSWYARDPACPLPLA